MARAGPCPRPRSRRSARAARWRWSARYPAPTARCAARQPTRAPPLGPGCSSASPDRQASAARPVGVEIRPCWLPNHHRRARAIRRAEIILDAACAQQFTLRLDVFQPRRHARQRAEARHERLEWRRLERLEIVGPDLEREAIDARLHRKDEAELAGRIED